MKLISALTAGTLLAAGGVVAVAGPAMSSSGLTTRCDGTATSLTIPGDLVVPRDASCDLTGVTVTGATRVAAGGDLVAEGTTFQGAVTVAEDAFFGAVDSSVAGRITQRQGFGVTLEGSEAGSVVARGVEGSEVQSVTWLEDGSTVTGRVDAEVGEVLVSSSIVGGNLRGVGTLYTDVVDSVVDGSLEVRDNVEGGVFCESEVYGDATYAGNMSVLQLGADGPVEVCESSSVWGGDVTVVDNMAEVVLNQNIVRGDVTLTGNDPMPTVGTDNRVRGTVNGMAQEDAEAMVAPQELARSVQRAAASPMAAAAVEAPSVASVLDREEAKRDLVAQRTAEAEAAAAAAGPIA